MDVEEGSPDVIKPKGKPMAPMGMGQRWRRLVGQLTGRSPFGGSLRVERLPNIKTGLIAARHFRTPLKILDYVFADDIDLKYLDAPGFSPILFIRDPEVIRAVTLETANKGTFDRDTLPTQGIARVVGAQNLLYSQGDTWKTHRAAASRPFGATAIQKPEIYHGIEIAVREAVEPRLEEIAERVRESPSHTCRMQLETDIKAVMLDVLVHVLFGSNIPHDELRHKYLPAIENVIRYIMVDTVANQVKLKIFRMPDITRKLRQLKKDRAKFEELVERVIATRAEGAGFWPLLTAAGAEEAITSNVRVFLAGALEATASYLSWALVNLARHPQARQKAFEEARGHVEISPAARKNAVYLQKVLAESLRLNNALYFLPRVALVDTQIETSKGTLEIPAYTHLVLATYHTNRCEKYWGIEATGYPATAFEPERWDEENLTRRGRTSIDNLHFGFGHGPRTCIGKAFSEAEIFVCLTLFLRRFEFTAPGGAVEADSGISTRPADKVDLELSLRDIG